MSEINIEVSPENSDSENEVTPVDVAEVEAIVSEAIEEAKEAEVIAETIETVEAVEDRIEVLESVIRALDEKVQDLETVVVNVESEIQDDDMRDAENNAEHEIMEVQIQDLETGEIGEDSETVSEVEEDVKPPHADQHILFAPATTVWDKFKNWYNA